MSLKCSLLGHRFGETTVERDREEEGSEVVITITELETCSRCGETRVVSENKEVTTMDASTESGSTGTGDSSGTDADSSLNATTASSSASSGTADASAGSSGGDPAPSSDDPAPSSDDPAPSTDDPAPSTDDPSTDDAEILGAGSVESDAQSEARASSPEIPDAEADATAATEDDDDAVIIDGDDASDGTGSATADPTADDGSVADDGATDEGGTTDAADFVDQSVGGVDSSGSDGGGSGEPRDDSGDADAWPEETTSADAVAGDETMDDWPDETKRDTAGDERAAGPSLEETASPTITVPEGMFKCSECGFETEVESSSLRAGDFCPDCHQGTLLQHEETGE